MNDNSASRKSQFSLFTMLLLMVIVGLTIALIVNRSQSEAKIKDLSAEVKSLQLQLPEHHWMREKIAIHQELLELRESLGPTHPRVLQLTRQLEVFSQFEKEWNQAVEASEDNE